MLRSDAAPTISLLLPNAFVQVSKNFISDTWEARDIFPIFPSSSSYRWQFEFSTIFALGNRFLSIPDFYRNERKSQNLEKTNAKGWESAKFTWWTWTRTQIFSLDMNIFQRRWQFEFSTIFALGNRFLSILDFYTNERKSQNLEKMNAKSTTYVSCS